ncbi:unnamed protein product [Soboliphyme baturini]|uniref:RING-type domain-containing protein n=1 Tax=Soboliphyme baturini TaxID=241478 RepID=A0A183IR15_9BILA|nr:unnamed protein product [Soboliphyme baturini]
MEKLNGNFFLYSAVCLNLMTWFVAAGAFLFDCLDLNVVVNMKSSSLMYRWGLQKKALITYNSIDLVIAALVVVLCMLILREIYREASCYFPNLRELRSCTAVFCGIALVLISTSKKLLWGMEYSWMRNLGPSARYVFLNYTMDEPVWNMIYLLTGVLVAVVGCRGTPVLAYCSVALTSVTFYPIIQYLWIDYRWMLTMQLAERSPSLPKPTTLLIGNITVSMVHVLVTFSSLVVLTRSLSDCAVLIKVPYVKLTSKLRTSVYVLAVSLIIIGAIFLVSDVCNMIAGTFYRVLYNPTAYVYLTYNEYFGSDMCQLFAFSNRTMCTKRVEQIGSACHFLEAFLAQIATVLSLCGVFLYARVCGLYQMPNFSDLRLSASSAATRTTCHKILKPLYAVQMAIGLATCVVSLSAEENFLMHPLLVTHNVIYRTTSAMVLVIFPVVQLALSNDLEKYPMKLIAVVAISIERMTHILTQLDYRNLTHLEIAWTVMTIAELITLLLQFALMNVAAVLFELGQTCSTASSKTITPNVSNATVVVQKRIITDTYKISIVHHTSRMMLPFFTSVDY